eukprot:4069364-Amphidinium_carterae.1
MVTFPQYLASLQDTNHKPTVCVARTAQGVVKTASPSFNVQPLQVPGIQNMLQHVFPNLEYSLVYET